MWEQRQQILLQTAKVTPFLDGGSQRLYVTERLKNDLNLQSSHTESLTIKGFGLGTGTNELCEVVNIRVAS